jgi:1,2-dihydroxy-3-keto-5-methylthiopentene dioxygenase
MSISRHLHTDEEIRFFVGGSGYFDVRHGQRADEPFIRIHGKAGDLIVLVGSVHR